MNETANDVEKWEDRHPEAAEGKLIVVENSPAAMMQMAQSRGMTAVELKELLQVQKEWEANEARKAYFAAVAAFKENPPEILKDKKNSQFNDSGYTSLGNLLKTVNPALGKHGLSASFEISQGTEIITVTCKLSHSMGHGESVSSSAPPDKSGGNSKNPIQQIKSTITYLKGVTFESVTGLAATDANLDDDGNAAGSPQEVISMDQATEITDLINETKSNIPAFLKWIKADSVETIAAKDYKKAITMLQAKKEKAA